MSSIFKSRNDKFTAGGISIGDWKTIFKNGISETKDKGGSLSNKFGTFFSSIGSGYKDTRKNELVSVFQKLQEGAKNAGESLTSYIDKQGKVDAQIREFVHNTDEAGQSAENFGAQLESTVGIGTQLGGVMKSLGAAALNMGVSFLAGMVISAIIKEYDNYVNRVKYAKEALQNSLDAYDSAGNEVKDLTQQLKECEAQMRELEGTNGITIVSDEQYQRLKETKAELEAQLKIKQAEQQIAAMQAANDARDLYRQGFDSGVDDSTGGASAHRDPYAQDHGPTANERQSPDKALNEAIADYNEKASTKKDVDADLLKVSDEMNKMTDKQSSAYGELVEQYNDLMDQSKEYSSQLADSAQNIQGLYSAVEQVINGYDVYMAAGGQLLPYEQIIYNSLKKSSDGFLDFADSLGVATDAEEENALAAVGLARSYTMSSSDMDTLKTEVDEVCSSYESLNAALTAQTTGKSVTLTDDLKQYANCLEYTNGVMQLNTERVRELAKAKADDKLATIAAYEEQERYQYSQNSTTIEKYIAALGDKKQAIVDGITVTKDTIDALRRDNEQIALNAKNYELLSSQIRQATGDYQAWLAGQNAPTQGTMFTDAGNAIKAVMEGLANGKVGTEKFKSAVGFIVPDDIDSEDKAAVKKYVDKLKRYLADNGSGVSNFINDAVKKGLMTGSAAKGADIVEGTRIQDFVDKLGLTEEVVRAIFGELETYGSKFDWSLEGLEDLDDALFEARTQYDNLRNDLEKQGIKVDVDDTDVKNAETALKKLSQYGNVDLTNRPQISADKMQAAGYTDFKDGDVATTYTASDFVWRGGKDDGSYVMVHYTPIMPNGEVLSPEALHEYLNETLAKSEDMLTADKIENGGKGILMKVDTGLTHEESANYRDNGVASDAIENMITQADTWDEKVHNYQATFYQLVDQDLKRISAEFGEASDEMQALSQQRYEMFNQTYSDTDFQQLKQEYELAQKYADLKVQARDISVRNTDGKSWAALQDVQQQMYDIADELSKTYGLDINADGAEQVIGDLKEQMLSLSGLSSINIDIIDEQAKKELQDLQSQLDRVNERLSHENIKGSNYYYKLLDDKSNLEEQVKNKQDEIDMIATLKVTLDESVQDAQDKKDELTSDKEFNLTANTSQAEAALKRVKALLDGIMTQQSVTMANIGLTSGGTEPKPAKAAGDPYVPKTETALIGELGPEIVVDPKNGSWRTYGDNGAEFATLPKGAIVFDAKKSKALLERGFVNGRGTAYAAGTAYPGGGIVSGHTEGITTYGKDSISEYNKQLAKNAKATKDSAKAAKDAAKAESNLTDWIERRIKLLDEQKSRMSNISSDTFTQYFGLPADQLQEISDLFATDPTSDTYWQGMVKLGELATSTGKSVQELYDIIQSGAFEQSRENAILTSLDIQKEKLATLKDGLQTYKDTYESFAAKLPDGYRDKIEHGANSVEAFAKETGGKDSKSGSDTLSQSIQDAITWYDKYQGAIADAEDAEREYYKTVEELHNNRLTALAKEAAQLENNNSLVQKSIDLAKASGHVVGASSYKKLISNTSGQISNKRSEISERESELEDLVAKAKEQGKDITGTEEYQSLKENISKAKGELIDLKKSQAEYNKQLKEMPITNMSTVIGMYKDISTAIQNWGAELEASGTTLSADYYQELIKNGSTIIDQYKEQSRVIQDVMDSYQVGSDNWNELYGQLQSVNSEMSSMVQNLKKWNEEMLKIPLDKINTYSSDLNTVKEALTDLQKDYTTVISAATTAIEDQTKAIQDQQKEFQKSIEKQKEAIQDKIDLLDKQNTKLQLQQELEQAVYNLHVATTQKTEAVIRNGQKVYEANADKIRNAQKSVQDATFNITKNNLQEQLDALNDQLDDYNDKVEEQIDALDKIKEKWSEIAENVQKAQDAAVANQYLGDGWKDKILSGKDDDIYTSFKQLYEKNADQIQAYEKQIDSTEKIYNLLNEYITAYKSGQISFEAAQAGVQGLLAQLNQNMTAVGNLDNVLKYMQTTTGAVGATAEQVLAGIQADLSKSADSLLSSLTQYQKNAGLISEYTSSWQQLTDNVSEMLKVLKQVRNNLKNIKRKSDDEDEEEEFDEEETTSKPSSSSSNSSGGSSSSSSSSSSKPSGPASDPDLKNRKHNEATGPAKEIEDKKKKYHSGLEVGTVGESGGASDTDAKLKLLGLRRLEPDEIPALLQIGEQVINEPQREMVLSNMKSAFDAGAQRAIRNTSQNVVVTIDKIVMPDVTDADGFARDLYKNIESSFSQQFSKTR